MSNLIPSSSIITDIHEQNYYWSRVVHLMKIPKTVQRFAGGNPISLQRTFYNDLKQNDFFISLKSDGIRYFLLLTMSFNDREPIALMIDRTLKMYEVCIWANPGFFENESLFDGELVLNNITTNQTFLVFDAIQVNGKSCISNTYDDRLQMLHNTILCIDDAYSDEDIEDNVIEQEKILARNNMYNLQIIPKQFVRKENIRNLWDTRLNSPYSYDGVIFTRNCKGIEIGTMKNTIKWKYAHTIDLMMNIHLYANSDTSGELINLDKIIKNYKVVNVPLTTGVAEFSLHIENHTLILEFIKSRTDKSVPNSVKTVKNTLKNTKEKISIEELCKLFES